MNIKPQNVTPNPKWKAFTIYFSKIFFEFYIFCGIKTLQATIRMLCHCIDFQR